MSFPIQANTRNAERLLLMKDGQPLRCVLAADLDRRVCLQSLGEDLASAVVSFDQALVRIDSDQELEQATEALTLASGALPEARFAWAVFAVSSNVEFEAVQKVLPVLANRLGEISGSG